MPKKRYEDQSLGINEAVKRLDAIINILFENSGPQGKPTPIVRRIEILRAAGLRPIEIARILGKSLTNVSVQLNLLKKKKEKRKGKAS